MWFSASAFTTPLTCAGILHIFGPFLWSDSEHGKYGHVGNEKLFGRLVPCSFHVRMSEKRNRSYLQGLVQGNREVALSETFLSYWPTGALKNPNL